MPSEIIVNIKIKPYLREYAIHKWGPEPILADRRNRLSGLIRPLLQAPPPRVKPTDGNLQVRLPFFKSLNIYSKNYLSPRSHSLIAQAINDDFLVDFIAYMNKAYLKSKVPGRRKMINMSIVRFMEEFHIITGKDVHEMLRKKYYRYRIECSKANFEEEIA